MHPHALKRNIRAFRNVAVYGVLRGGYDLMAMANQYKIGYIYIDHGYFGRSKHPYEIGNEYYRATRNATQQITLKDRPSDRLEQFNLQLKDWRLDGDTVLFAYQSPHWNHAFRSNNWVNMIRHRISGQMKSMKLRPQIRHKTAARIPVEWSRVYCVVTYSSAIALHAVVRGIPVIVSPQHALSAVGATEYDLKNLWMGDRLSVFNSLAYSQFTVEEMRSGFAWQELTRDD
jgi:hypothetical protein